MVSFGLAAISDRWVESPIRWGGFWNKMAPGHILRIGTGLSVLVGVLAWGVTRLESQRVAFQLGPLGSDLVRQIEAREDRGRDCFTQEAIGTEKCNFSFFLNHSLKEEASKEPVLAIWGDSHACSYFPMLVEYAKQTGGRIAQYCKGDTPPLLDHPLLLTGAEDGPMSLHSFEEATLWDLQRKVQMAAPQPVSVVLVAHWMAYERGQLKRRLGVTLLALKAIGVDRVLLILPYPEFPSLIIRCLQRHPDQCQVLRSTFEQKRQNWMEIFQSFESPFVRVVDPLPFVCDDQTCPQVFHGLAVVIDDNHPSLGAVLKIGQGLWPDLNWLLHRSVQAVPFGI